MPKYEPVISKLREGTEAFERADALFRRPPIDTEEPTFWEKLFQPFSSKVQAWNSRIVSERVTPPQPEIRRPEPWPAERKITIGPYEGSDFDKFMAMFGVGKEGKKVQERMISPLGKGYEAVTGKVRELPGVKEALPVTKGIQEFMERPEVQTAAQVVPGFWGAGAALPLVGLAKGAGKIPKRVPKVTPGVTRPTLQEYVTKRDPTWREADHPSAILDRYRAAYEREFGTAISKAAPEIPKGRIPVYEVTVRQEIIVGGRTKPEPVDRVFTVNARTEQQAIKAVKGAGNKGEIVKVEVKTPEAAKAPVTPEVTTELTIGERTAILNKYRTSPEGSALYEKWRKAQDQFGAGSEEALILRDQIIAAENKLAINLGVATPKTQPEAIKPYSEAAIPKVPPEAPIPPAKAIKPPTAEMLTEEGALIKQIRNALVETNRMDEVSVILPDGTALTGREFKGIGAFQHLAEDLPSIQRWLDAGVVRTGLEADGVFFVEIRGGLSQEQYSKLSKLMSEAEKVRVDFGYFQNEITKSLEGTPNVVRTQLRDLIGTPGFPEGYGLPEAIKPPGIEVPLVEKAIPAVTEARVPPVKPPTGVSPPAKVPPTRVPAGAPPSGQPIMADLQNADELVTTMNQPDVYRKIANLPVVRRVMSYLNPSGVAKTVPEKAIVARAALREEGNNKAIGAYSRLETQGNREKVWGKTNTEGFIEKGELGGLSLDDVLTYRKKYGRYMTPQQKEWAKAFHELESEKLQLLRRNGIEINELSFTEGGEYVGRRVAGRINPLTNEIEEAAFIGAPGPGRPGAKMGAEKSRYFKDINEAIEKGFRYLPPDEALFLNIKGAYNRIADKQVADWILARIPWRTSTVPMELALARDVAKSQRDKARQLVAALNRAVRGERVPGSTINSIASAYPEESNALRRLIPQLQKGGETGADVQALTTRGRELLKDSQLELYKVQNAFMKARETALKTHFGEATVQAPAFAGKILTGTEARETAQTLNKAFISQYGDIDRIISSANKVNAIGRYFLLAADASPMLIQLITFTFRFPKIWGKSAVGFTRALFSPEAQAAYLLKNNDIIQKSRNVILSKGGQTEYTEAFRAGGLLSGRQVFRPTGERLAKRIALAMPRAVGKVARAILEPFQRGFEGALDTAGIELRKSFDYMATTPQRTAEVEQFINEIRGVTSSARIGVSPEMRAAETVAVLAPRYNRAIAALVSDIARGGIRGDQARKALVALLGGGAALAAGISLARGEGWEGVKEHLDIRDSKKFVTWEVAGQNIGPGSKIRSLLVLLGRLIKEPERAVDHANNFMRGNFSIVLGTGFDVLTGRNYIGEPTRPGKGVTFSEGMIGLSKRIVADNFIAIWVHSVALEGGDIAGRITRGVTEFLGARAYPILKKGKKVKKTKTPAETELEERMRKLKLR